MQVHVLAEAVSIKEESPGPSLRKRRINLDEVKKLLQNINDEAFEVSEIKNLFKDKLSELTTSDITHKMLNMSRKELIRAIDKIKK